MTDPAFKPDTVAVRAGIDCDPVHGAVTPSLVLSSNFSFAGLGQKRAYDYTRSGNPTRDQLACALAELEGGHSAVVTASGMAAVTLVVQLLKPGQRLLLPQDCYGGCWRLFTALADKGHFDIEWCDLSDARAARAAMQRGVDVLWIETPSNPLLRISDIRALADAAHQRGALVVVDNTFLTPLLQRPLALGADVVLHSTTKYINGHSDVIGGAVIAGDAAVAEQLAWWANALGLAGSPFDALMTLRGLRTLGPRLRMQQATCAEIAALLHSHPAVRKVHYPGLSHHPQHALAGAQQSGFGAMLSFELHGEADLLDHFVRALRCFTLAESLGGVESLIAHPASMTHAAMAAEARRRAGISDQLLRLSVGTEDAVDLCADLSAALAQVGCARAQRGVA